MQMEQADKKIHSMLSLALRSACKKTFSQKFSKV